MNSDVSYFAPGPAKMPRQVLESLKDELIHYENSGVSIMELSHRSKDFEAIIKHAESLLREMLKIPSDYDVLFLQGGGVGQFAAVPLNLISKTGKADYIVTGSWSAKAAKEAKKYGKVNLVLPETDKYTNIPPSNEWKLSSDAAYIYYCANETVDGVEFHNIPESPHDVPLVCDMSSNICSRSMEVSKFGVIFGCAQKNIGCAGVTVVIVKKSLLGNAMEMCPSILNYSVMAKAASIYNTPPTFAIHVMRRVLEWTKVNGGIEGMERDSLQKSAMIYSLITNSGGFYFNQINEQCRSRMNIVFRVGCQKGDEVLEKKFLEKATQEGLLSLKGHRSVGGIRASLYNAVTLGDVTRLTKFMENFKKTNQQP